MHEGRPNVVDHLRSGRIALLINTPLGKASQETDEAIRIAAVRHRVPYTTTTSAAWAAAQGIRYLTHGERIVRPLGPPDSPRRRRRQPSFTLEISTSLMWRASRSVTRKTKPPSL